MDEPNIKEEVMRKLLFVLVGPTNAGKRTLIKHLTANNYAHGAARVVLSTTRPKMPHEEHGIDYHFPSLELFERQKAQGNLVEHAVYGPHRYGINLVLLRRQLECSRLLLAGTNLRGAELLTEALKDVCAVYHCGILSTFTAQRRQPTFPHSEWEARKCEDRMLRVAIEQRFIEPYVLNRDGQLGDTIEAAQIKIDALLS